MFDDIYNFLDHNCLINKKHKASDLDSIALLLLMLINLYMFAVFFWIYFWRLTGRSSMRALKEWKR